MIIGHLEPGYGGPEISGEHRKFSMAPWSMTLGDVASADCCLQQTLRWWWEREGQWVSWESDKLRSYIVPGTSRNADQNPLLECVEEEAVFCPIEPLTGSKFFCKWTRKGNIGLYSLLSLTGSLALLCDFSDPPVSFTHKVNIL